MARDVDVAVYLSTTNFQNRTAYRKKQTLLAFASGARRTGASVEIVKDNKLVKAKLAVILGWYSPYAKAFGVNGVRRNVIEFQKKNGGRVMPIDAGCWKYADSNNQFLRYSLDGVYYDQAFYANENSSSDRFDKICEKLDIQMLPWNKRLQGEYVLLLMQRDSGWSMKGMSPINWAIEKVERIRSICGRPIIIRPHPAVPLTAEARKQLARFKHVVISDPTRKTLQQDIAKAAIAMNFNSSSGVAAIMAGVPLFVDDKSSVCYEVANKNISVMADPEAVEFPDREQWAYNLAACHWSDDESFLGQVYNKFKPYL